MRYSDYINELGFLPSQIDDIKDFAVDNGGVMTAIINNGKKEVRMFFTNGENRKINISKTKNEFSCELKHETKKFKSFDSMMEFLNKET